MARRRKRESPNVLSASQWPAGEPSYRSRLSTSLPRRLSALSRQLEAQGALRRLLAALPIRRNAPIQQVQRIERLPRQRIFSDRQTIRSWRKSSPLQTVVSRARHDFCSKRQARREVLFAQRVAGRSGGSPGRRGGYRRSSSSSYSCGR